MAMLPQFKKFAADKLGINLGSPGSFEQLENRVQNMKPAELKPLLPPLQTFFSNVSQELPPEQQPAIQQKLVDLQKADADEKGKKDALCDLISNKSIQEYVMNQLNAHKVESGVSDEALQGFSPKQKQSFVHDAFNKFCNNFDSHVNELATRNRLDGALGLIFDYLFSALDLMLEIMLHKSGIDIFSKNSKNGFSAESNLPQESDPRSPYFMK